MKCALFLLLTTVLIGLVASDTPTLVPASPFNSYDDAKALHTAISGWLTIKRAAITDVLCRRASTQRAQIATTYQTAFGHTLVQDFDGVLKNEFKFLCDSMSSLVTDYLATDLRRVLTSTPDDITSIEEVLLSRSAKDVSNINRAYSKSFGSTLRDDIEILQHTEDVQKLLAALSDGVRVDSSRPIEKDAVTQDALNLKRATEAVNGTDISVFINIFTSRSYSHLNTLYIEFELKYKTSMESFIRSQFSGDFEYLLLNIVKYSRNKANFLAQRLFNAMSGKKADTMTLQRLIINRCEIDLGDIKGEYEDMYKMTLASQVTAKVSSGAFRDGLLKLIA